MLIELVQKVGDGYQPWTHELLKWKRPHEYHGYDRYFGYWRQAGDPWTDDTYFPGKLWI